MLASQTVWTPFDVVTQRIMVASGASGTQASDASVSHVIRDVWQTSGLRGYYRGFGVTLIAYLPGGSVWWAAYGGAREAAAGQQAVPIVLESQKLVVAKLVYCHLDPKRDSTRSVAIARRSTADRPPFESLRGQA